MPRKKDATTPPNPATPALVATPTHRTYDDTPTDDAAAFRADRIRALAYAYYLARGALDGDPVADWLRAEADIDSPA